MISDAGIRLIKKYEGLSLVPYRCPAGIMTIGYGHAYNEDDEGLEKHFKNGITREEAQELLKHDLEVFEKQLDELKLNLNQNQKDAVMSLIYNIGFERFKKSKTLKMLKAKDFDQMCFEWADFCHITKDGEKIALSGLVNRRKAELDLFFS